MLVDVSVAEAAELLGVHRSRVEQLLRSDRLRGRRAGRLWFVDERSVLEMKASSRAAGRPLAPARAWGLLDLLDGGAASWLSPVARSQIRARLRGLDDVDAGRWRALLRHRSKILDVRVHPAALPRLIADDPAAVFPAGVARAAEVGADLVAVDPLPEVYIRADDWPRLARRWHAELAPEVGNLRVRLPRDVWPFERGEVGPAALAADLVESAEPRAAAAGEALLREALAHARLSE